MLLKVKDQSISSEIDRITKEINDLKKENESLRIKAATAIKNQENDVKAMEYKEESIKYKTLMEQKDKLLTDEKEKNEWMSKEFQRAKNELFSVQLENKKNNTELFTCKTQLKEIQNAMEIEIEKRKRVEEDKEHYVKMIEMSEKEQIETDDQSLLSAIKELCLIILSKVIVFFVI